MKTYNLVCKKIYKYVDVEADSKFYWRVERSSNNQEFPPGMVLASEKSSKAAFFLEKGTVLGPPYIDINFEKWLNSFDLESYSQLKPKPKLNITIFFRLINRYDPTKYDIYPGVAILEPYTGVEMAPGEEHIILFISLDERKFASSDDNPFPTSTNYVQLEIMVKNINEKLEELLQNVFYSENSYLSRIVRMEDKISSIEKEQYISKEDFNIITLFFRGGINNFILFLIILIIFNEIFTLGPLRTVKIYRIIENYFAPGATHEELIKDIDKP